MIADAPEIRDAEINGISDDPYICPYCGEEAARAYIVKKTGEVLGCENCIDWVQTENWREA